MYGIVERLLVMAFYASVMIIVVIAVRAVIKNAPRQICCVLWALVAFRLICPFEIPCAVSVYNLADNTAVSEEEMLNKTDDLDGAGQTGKYDFKSAAGEESVSAYAQHTPAVLFDVSDSAAGPQIVFLWAGGTFAMFAWMAYGSRRLRKTVAASAPLQPHLSIYKNVYICDDIRVPFTAGIFRPRIYIPSGMDQASISHVIAHERAHIKRGDNITKALGCVLRAVYWFDPLVWLAYELFSRDIETACDERVIKDMDREERAAYSQALLNCSTAGGRRITAYSAAFSSSSGIKERVNRVMNYKKPALWVSAAAVVLCIAAAACFMTVPSGTPAGNETFSYDDLENSGTAGDVKIWNEQQIKSAFMKKISESNPKDEITIIDCTAVTDNVYDTVGAVLYRLSSQPEVIETAFVKSDGFFQTCGTYTQVCDEPELTYLGNGTVIFKAVRENGEIYGHILTFSQSDDGKNTHFKASEQEIM